jgi:putative membrane protein
MCWFPTSVGGVHTMWGMMGFMGLGMIFWVAILALVVYFIVQLFRRHAANGGQSDALRILQERYARGEIDRDTFNRMKDDLK